ncbi:MAG TPA: hypothetical protein DHB48_11190, partial [Sphingobium sp.]|nr:hypothetical protein [Sphingobium sp.]
MMTKFSSRLLATAVSVIAVANVSSVFAQEQSASPTQGPEQASSGGVADIIVTAQKRAQNLNDVGLSITAASADQLASAGG